MGTAAPERKGIIMSNMGKTLYLDGGGKIDRPPIAEPEDHLREFLEGPAERDSGRVYYDYKPVTPPDRLLPEDVAITLVLNSRASGRAVSSVAKLGNTLDLGTLPDKSLQQTNDAERAKLAEHIAQVCGWPGFKASLATKTLHKKRPDLIPVLDNRAIFGAYMKPQWGRTELSSADSIGDRLSIEKALNFITADLVRPENAGSWPILQAMAPERKLIEVFDMVWWIHFQRTERELAKGH
jgi:hypothetical protein